MLKNIFVGTAKSRIQVAARCFSAASRPSQHTKVAIVGAGPAGNSVSSQLVNSGVFQPSDITILDASEIHHYQPGYTNIAGGVWSGTPEQKRAVELKYIMKDRADLLHPGINWVREHVGKLDPDNNQISTQQTGSTITYDYLVMATGVELRYDLVDGAMEALMNPSTPVGSMYRLDLAHKMSALRESFKGGKAIFTLPVMPVKCGGAPQKIMYLSEETWRKNGVRANADIHFYTSVGNMFPNCQKFADALYPLAQSKNIDVHFHHVIKSVDGDNRTVTFHNSQTKTDVTTDFDLLHVVPPQTAHQFVRESPLAHANGFVDVDQHTLRHNKYENVYALGDVANLPTAKTAAAVFSQAPVVTHNLITQHRQDQASSPVTYSGYSSCPLFVGDNKLMLMEFKYGGEADETFSTKQEVPTRSFYWLKKHAFPFAYWQFAPQGKWFGKDALAKPDYMQY